MHSKGLWRPDSEEFSAHPEPSRTPAAHARGRPASSRLLCELLDRILAGVHADSDRPRRQGPNALRLAAGGLHDGPAVEAAVRVSQWFTLGVTLGTQITHRDRP